LYKSLIIGHRQKPARRIYGGGGLRKRLDYLGRVGVTFLDCVLFSREK